MTQASPDPALLDKGTLSFTIESRVLRELGERLVKQSEVAIIELVKNAYDADATECTVTYDPQTTVSVSDDGEGMTLARFTSGWMRIGTSSKEDLRLSQKYCRLITGEKGIGRFAVRFLGRSLHLETVADDPERETRTRLIADFDWPQFDRHEDLGLVKVPYRLEAVDLGTPTGTTLVIGRLRSEVAPPDLKAIRTASIGMLTPLRSLFRATIGEDTARPSGSEDPGFLLRLNDGDDDDEGDVAAAILKEFTLRAELSLVGSRLEINIFKRYEEEPYLQVIDTYPNEIGKMYADIRFFPRRPGAFRDMPVDGRRAQSWIIDNAGVAVFDRNFRVQPYGSRSDDWLKLQADAARNHRHPRSVIAQKHFAMQPQEQSSTALNWMLRLPQSLQLVGLVQVEARRNSELDPDGDEEGLVASADREGFVENKAFKQLQDLARGAVEVIAFADRRAQQEEQEALRTAQIASLRQQTQAAIQEIRTNPGIAAPEKARIVTLLTETQQRAERQEETGRERQQQLEIMSLLGVVAGFMTHEFGIAVRELEDTHRELAELAKAQPRFLPAAESFANHIKNLKEFVTYSSGYIKGAKTTPSNPYPVRPRLQQVVKYFGKYAEDRNISVEITAEADLLAPLVPLSLYNGIALNLYTNALKAVTAKTGNERGVIAFRAWSDSRWHYLDVSDTGVGVPSSLHERVFDPLFTTTESQNDPLGSGMGLGLALVKRGAEAFGGKAELVDPPPGFATCVRVRLPSKAGG